MSDPTSTSTLSQKLSEQDLHVSRASYLFFASYSHNRQPLTNAAAPGDPTPGGADINIELDVTLANFVFAINGVPYSSPEIPVLLQILNGAPAASLMPNGSVYSLAPNKTVEIVIPGGVSAGP